MNDESLLPFQRLDAYKVAKELAKRVHEAQIRDAELRDQATRASKSAFLGLCEGLRGFVGGRKALRFAGCGVKARGISLIGYRSAAPLRALPGRWLMARKQLMTTSGWDGTAITAPCYRLRSDRKP